jgi:O-antigen ligase
MAGPASAPLPRAEAQVWSWGRFALGGVLVLGFALTFALAASEPFSALLVPAAFVGAGLLWRLGGVPLGHLCGVMALFMLSIGYQEGIQPAEIGFALYYAGFLLHWYVTRLFVRRERVVRDGADAALAFFLVYLAVSPLLTSLYVSDPATVLSDLINFSFLAFFFPFREACERSRRGPWVLVGILVLLGTYAMGQNLLLLNRTFTDATALWQIARGRIAMNEMPLLVGALFALVLSLAVRPRAYRLGFLLLFGALTAALIAAQSRAYYVDFVLGLLVLGVAIGRVHRRALLTSSVVGVAGLVAIAFLFLGDYVMLVTYGLIDRALSIGTATTDDISLINRFFETEAAWALVLQNPVLGYGPGTVFGFFDAIYQETWVKPYVHNGYLMLWFKFGIVGLLAILVVWARAIAVSFRTARDAATPAPLQLLGVATGACLIAIIPSHFSAATFSTGDTVMIFTLLCGLASGLASPLRADRLDPAAP